MAETMYECHNEACELGSYGVPGVFTGGMTAEQKSLKTGKPVESLEEGTDFGDGICPMCGKPGEAIEETFEPLVGTDEYEELHVQAAEFAAPKIEELKANTEITEEERVAGMAEISSTAQSMVEEGAQT
jgi:hypothetical protein